MKDTARHRYHLSALDILWACPMAYQLSTARMIESVSSFSKCHRKSENLNSTDLLAPYQVVLWKYNPG